MKRSIAVVLAALLTMLVVVGCSSNKSATTTSEQTSTTQKQAKNETLILATTTSTKDTGLLDVLIPAFEKKTGITVKTIAVGTGEALKMGERGDADVLLVHARSSEDEFMAKGFGKLRKDVMHNDFVLIGPKDDPARLKGAVNAVEAFSRISGSMARSDMGARRVKFVSRGDDSGTNKKELKIWEKAGGMPSGNAIGRWYIKTGQGMAATIRIANEKQGYTLSDRGTFLVQKDNIDLGIVLEKSKDLLNPYGVIVVNPDRFPKVNADGAMKFVDFITSAEGQKIIAEFGKDKYGQPLFIPDAAKSAK